MTRLEIAGWPRGEYVFDDAIDDDRLDSGQPSEQLQSPVKTAVFVAAGFAAHGLSDLNGTHKMPQTRADQALGCGRGTTGSWSGRPALAHVATFGRAYTALTKFLAAHGRSAIGRPVTDVALSARQLVGREDELAAIVELLDAPEQLPGVAVLPGEAGIGKTTLWLAGIDAASALGYRIMSCRPSEAESRFAFAGLADLQLAGRPLTEPPRFTPVDGSAPRLSLIRPEGEIPSPPRPSQPAGIESCAV